MSIIIFCGIVIFVSMLLIGAKLPRWLSLRLLGHDLATDICFTLIVYAMHWGTFTGLLAAGAACAICSAFTIISRKLFGYIRNGVYTPGIFALNTEGMHTYEGTRFEYLRELVKRGEFFRHTATTSSNP